MTELRADCTQCHGLCCVALAFVTSADFPFAKDAGDPCPNLTPADRCTIHDDLRPRGFAGCAAYDCFGAGQRVSQVTFGGRHWRTSPELRAPMFALLPAMRQLHELLWYLADARRRPECAGLRARLEDARSAIDQLAGGPPDELERCDLDAVRAGVNPLLLRASHLVRARVAGRPDRRHANLAGARLRQAHLHGADLRGAYLMGADLRDADLRRADLIGADLRDADLRGTDLDSAIFLTRGQLGAARGDGRTRLPDWLDRPGHWAN
ncbi:MAG: pentapeptide repeat-containing protein [Jatrophihabitans sp.]